ncbi:hypothetical protein [Vibrio owensii]|uniref:hypothetical protein n=1 Tax=Vibrio owensii TaxID=696485 RepID=UPI003CC5DD22
MNKKLITTSLALFLVSASATAASPSNLASDSSEACLFDSNNFVQDSTIEPAGITYIFNGEKVHPADGFTKGEIKVVDEQLYTKRRGALKREYMRTVGARYEICSDMN